MEARVDVGEMDVVLMKPGQNAHLEVDAFKDRKFNGRVTEVADSANGFGQTAASASMGGGGGGSSTGDATKFEVHIRLKEKEEFRPGMSVTAEIETRLRTNVLCVPIASVTARLPKPASNTNDPPAKTNLIAGASSSNSVAMTNSSGDTNYVSRADKKAEEANKQVDVVFILDGDHVKMIPVKIGISDDNYWEVTDGLQEGQEVVSGGYHAISHDLEDGKKVVKGKGMPGDAEKKPM
jgi:HlyD family secretion protein